MTLGPLITTSPIPAASGLSIFNSTSGITLPTEPIFCLFKIKAAEQQRKERKDAIDAQLKQEQIQVERERIAVDAQKENKRTAADMQKHQSSQRHDGMKHVTQLMANSQKSSKPKGE